MSESSSVRQLRDAISDKLVQNSARREFIPENDLYQLMSRETVCKVFEEIVRTGADGGTFHRIDFRKWEHVFERYRKVLAVLVSIGQETLIMSFLNYERSDKNLPFYKEELGIIHEKLPESQFLTKQYCFIAIKFKKGDERYIPEEWILPFIKDIPIENGEGGFGKTYEVEIHESYYDPNMWTFLEGQKQRVFARKELYSSDYNNKHFTREHSALKFLQVRRQHPNIIPLLACFRYGTQYSFLFPRADCDLRTYFEQTDPPHTHQETFYLFERISKLASGLNEIHNCEISLDANGRMIDYSQIGYHRDLKPSNILKMGEFFMICDFGLSQFKDNGLSSKMAWGWGRSTYFAPECEKGANVGRLADIWSLGCIFAEVVTFAILGAGGSLAFSVARQQILTTYTTDLFYKYGTVKLQDAVLEWFEHLRIESGRSPFISDILQLVEEMLGPLSTRPRAVVVMSKFSEILGREKRRNNIADHIPTDTIGTHPPVAPPDLVTDNPEPASTPPSPIQCVITPSNDNPRSRVNQPTPLFYKVPEFLAKSPKGKSPFGYLKEFDTVFLIDDSESMIEQWDSVALALRRFLELATIYDSDGVDLHFMSSPECVNNAKTVEAVFSTFRRIQAGGTTSISLSLDNILSDYMFQFSANRRTKRLNLIVITDGDITALENPEDVIINTAMALDSIMAPKYQVGVQFALIGSSETTQKIFQDMDDDLWRRNDIRDMVDTTPYDPDMDGRDDEILLKIMCGAVNRPLDNKSGPGRS